MPSWSLTISLGSNEEGQTRREAYETAAEKKGTTLNDWVKRTLDAASGVKIKKD